MRFSLFFLVSLIIAGCDTNETADTRLSVGAGDTIVNAYAEAFRIIKYQPYNEIQVLDPSNDSVIARYGKGEFVPEHGIIKIPEQVQSIAALSSTHVGMLKMLGEENSILGVSNTRYLCEDGKSKSWINYGELGQADPELYVKHQPSLIMYSGFKNDILVLKKLRNMGVPAMINYDWKETHPLGRAEWLKVFGELFNCENRANELFDSIQKRYLQLSKYIQNDSTSPSVLVGTVYGDVFNVPAGESYMAKMLEDANVDYVYADSKGTASLSLTLEEVITTNRATDFWLNVAANSSSDVLAMNQRFEMLSSFQEGNLYTYYSNVNCFWEQSAVMPDKVLSDLIHIFHPELFDNPMLHYYERIDEK